MPSKDLIKEAKEEVSHRKGIYSKAMEFIHYPESTHLNLIERLVAALEAAEQERQEWLPSENDKLIKEAKEAVETQELDYSICLNNGVTINGENLVKRLITTLQEQSRQEGWRDLIEQRIKSVVARTVKSTRRLAVIANDGGREKDEQAAIEAITNDVMRILSLPNPPTEEKK